MGMGSGQGKRPWVRWVGLAVFVLLLGAVFVRLGEWQLDRLEQRKQENTIVQQHRDAPVVEWTEVFGDAPITDDDQWQRVRATGTFDAAHQFQVRLRNNDGARGIEVVTPLHTADGIVLVNRGFIAVNTSEIAVLPEPPAGEVTVIGHVRRSEQGKPEATTPVDGMMRLVNAPAIAAALGEDLPDGYIGALEVTPAQSGDLVPVVPPALDEGPHFWYAVQWFMFATIAAGGLFVFIRADIRELQGKRRRHRARTKPPVSAAGARPVDDGGPAEPPGADAPSRRSAGSPAARS